MALRLQTMIPVLAGFAAVAACQPETPDDAGDNIVNETRSLPPIPVADPPFDRSALLLAVARAGSAAALGRDDTSEQRKLDGKRLEIRIRFGCPNGVQRPLPAAISAAPFAIGFDSEKRTLRVRATPDLTRESPGIATLGGEEIEAVEGFWIYRPWLLADGCPAPPPKAPAVPDGEETEALPQVEAERQLEPAVRRSRVGIAHFFSKTDSRTGRRDNRSYEATKVLGEGEEPSRQGYNLVLSGRLIKLPGGRVIACRMTDADAPPECVVSAQFDRVWIERPDTGAMIAEWSN